MGFIPEITCRRCGNKYSGLRNRCPKCGAPRTNQPTRVPPTTASATPNTAAAERSAVNTHWQFIFGAILIVAVIVAVIVLIATGGGKSSAGTTTGTTTGGTTGGTAAGGSTTISDTYLPEPSASPEPTAEVSPTPQIQTLGIIFLNKAVTDISITQEGALEFQLTGSAYPVTDAPITWSSSNETVLKVDDTGKCTIVGASPDKWVHATIFAECLGLKQPCIVYIPSYQAAYLTENLYDPNVVDEWDVEQARLKAEAAAATTTPGVSAGTAASATPSAAP